MNKKQLIAKLSGSLNLSKADAERTFDTITNTILDALKGDDSVKIAGLTAFVCMNFEMEDARTWCGRGGLFRGVPVKPPRAIPGVLLHNSLDWQGSCPRGFKGNLPVNNSLAGGEGSRVLS